MVGQFSSGPLRLWRDGIHGVRCFRGRQTCTCDHLSTYEFDVRVVWALASGEGTDGMGFAREGVGWGVAWEQ